MAEQNFSAALATWKEINLSDLQKSLDGTALELVENQKENLVGRKKLAESTREFKKLPDDPEKFNAIKILLKSYQSEIDSLTRRSKMSENAFLNVYKLLADAPDPYPLLDAAVDQTVKVAEAKMLESELGRLRDENSDLRKQVSEMSGLEEKKRRAEVKAEQLEASMEEMIQERVTQKENSLNAEYDERMRNYSEREKDLQRQVETVKSQLREMHNSAESTQAKLLDASQRQEQDVAARLAELDMVAADLLRANERVATVERRNELLRSEIESVRSGSAQAERVKGLENQISELEAEASRLLKTLEQVKESKIEVERLQKKKLDESLKELSLQTKEIESLKTKVKQFSDYDEIKRELEIMKYVEFSGLGDDDDDGLSPSSLGELRGRGDEDGVQLPDPNADIANKQLHKSLENLLVTKNRRLLEDLTKLRVTFEELTGQHTRSEEMVENLQSEVDRVKSLNERLEMDLMNVHSRGEDSKPQGLMGLEIGKGEGRHSPAPFAANGDASILPIVTGQRDRFRQRNAELEEELRKQFEVISDLRAEVKSLQADNLKLYEKVRYMQSYRDGPAGPSNSNTSSAVTARTDEIGRYKDKYEESMNPFEAFKGREAQRAIQALNPLERATFALTKAIIGNKRARSLFILYTASLHLLILFVLYNTMAASDSHHDAIPISPIS